jgi:hypothetical protein
VARLGKQKQLRREGEGETELIINESFPATCHLSTVGENNSVSPHNKSEGKFACSGQKELRNYGLKAFLAVVKTII